MTSSSVKSDDSTDEVLPLSVILWNEITKLRQEIVQLNNVIKELKEPKSMIEVLVDHILEGASTPSTTTPPHECEFITDPERGKCSFCATWGSAIVMVHPELFEEEDAH